MHVHNNRETIIDNIPVPMSVNEKQATLARKYVKANVEGNLNIQAFCKENNISTKTLYVWLENPDFKWYLDEIQNVVIPSSEMEAYQKIKQHILKIADKNNPNIKDIQLFLDTFSYVVEADKRERMRELGISDSNKPLTDETLEDKKAVLLQRLTSNNKKEK